MSCVDCVLLSEHAWTLPSLRLLCPMHGTSPVAVGMVEGEGDSDGCGRDRIIICTDL